ncbi:MAG: hypothetical protein AUK47_18580 [Deltaproteobacteria bacterium CG2_30_63_29]|nr:MAG: hypothetical protein AUK47_18580 [Deltaproteobacteria bacterium CG2_30_63_29]PJB37484.1 MAG: hypothetical protein CO108_21055 [Deltaproteobacteria bacterium CG_4_9_14_3_um_filter_63_12]
MYLCPRCELKYEQAPDVCTQCKRPLILNKRYRIETSIEEGPGGEDFDVLDLKTQAALILRELRVRKSEMAAKKAEIDRYHANVKRLKAMKYEGQKVLADAFETEHANSVTYSMVFDADAWAGLGEELYFGGDAGGGEGDDLPDLEGRDMDPELAARLAKLTGGSPAKPAAKPAVKPSAKTAAAAAPIDDDDDEPGGALVKAKSDLPAKQSSGGSAIATKAKVVVVSSVLVIILAIVAAMFLL